MPWSSPGRDAMAALLVDQPVKEARGIRGAVVVLLAAGDVGLEIVQRADALRLEVGDLLEGLGFPPSQAYLVARTKHGSGRAVVAVGGKLHGAAKGHPCAHGMPSASQFALRCDHGRDRERLGSQFPDELHQSVHELTQTQPRPLGLPEFAHPQQFADLALVRATSAQAIHDRVADIER